MKIEKSEIESFKLEGEEAPKGNFTPTSETPWTFEHEQKNGLQKNDLTEAELKAMAKYGASRVDKGIELFWTLGNKYAKSKHQDLGIDPDLEQPLIKLCQEVAREDMAEYFKHFTPRKILAITLLGIGVENGIVINRLMKEKEKENEKKPAQNEET